MDNLDAALTAEENKLISARDSALVLAQVKPTGVNRKAYKKACRDLEEFLKAKNDPGETEQTFASVLEVVDYLDSAGWKISKSTVYDHWKKDGKLKARADGSFVLSTVQEYARHHLQYKDGTPGSDQG